MNCLDNKKFKPFERLKSNIDFSNVFNKHRKIFFKNLLILWKFNKKNNTRIGIITSKKVSKLAVKRNNIRRVIRESFRHTKCILHRLDIIVIARHPAADLNKSELRKETDFLWKKLQKHSQKH